MVVAMRLFTLALWSMAAKAAAKVKGQIMKNRKNKITPDQHPHMSIEEGLVCVLIVQAIPILYVPFKTK